VLVTRYDGSDPASEPRIAFRASMHMPIVGMDSSSKGADSHGSAVVVTSHGTPGSIVQPSPALGVAVKKLEHDPPMMTVATLVGIRRVFDIKNELAPRALALKRRRLCRRTRSMAVRRSAFGMSECATLSSRQRFAVCRGVVEPPARALELPDADVDVVFFKSKRVPVANLRAAKLTAVDLKARGVAQATVLRELGFDALDLTDASFCASCVSAFGVENVRRAFLLTAGDAVALAGSVATFQLDLSVRRLLEACAGVPDAAQSVLQQCEPRGGALQGVAAEVLLDAGLRADALVCLGYWKQTVREQTGALEPELLKLGF
jgi:hypothetical protein